MKSTHHFTLLAMVMSETSSSTSARLINNTKTRVPGQGTSYCLENEMIKCNIGDSFDSLLDFRLYDYPYSSDISKCYLRILVDDLTAKLRLLVWFDDPQNMTGVKIYRRPTMDFRDTCSSLVVRIVQEKFLSQLCKLELTKHLILNCAYADNYSGSFKDESRYLQVKTDMNEVHEKIGLPLKCTYTAVQTDDKILDELGIGDDEKAIYNFL